MLEPRIWDNATDLVPLSRAHSEDLADIAAGTYGFEPGEDCGDEDFVRRYAEILLKDRP